MMMQAANPMEKRETRFSWPKVGTLTISIVRGRNVVLRYEPSKEEMRKTLQNLTKGPGKDSNGSGNINSHRSAQTRQTGGN